MDVTCALRSDWTETEGWTSLVDKLQKEMTFTGTVTLTGAQIRTLADAGQSALYAVGWNTIGNIPGRVLGGSQVQVPAALLELPVAVADDLVVDVVDPSNNNAPVPGARVTLTLVTNDAQHSYGPLTTDANGQVTFTNIPYGTYRVDVVYSHASTDPPHDHYATRTGIFRAGVEEAVVELRLNTQVEVNTKVNAADVLEPGETAQSASADNLQNAVVWPESTEGERHQIEVDLKVVQVPVAAGTPEAAAAQEIVANFGADTSIPADPGQVTGSPLIMTDFVDATITATTTVTDMATGAQTSQSTQSVKNTVQLVDVFIPVPDKLLTLLERFGLTTDYIRVYRNHQPEDQQAAPELTELTRITENNRAREGFYTVTLTDQGESRSYVVIRAQKFSVYAFGVVLHSEPVAPVAPVEPGQGGGTGGGVTRYPVETESGGRGSASASHDRAPAGTKVTVTVTPDEGYRLNAIVVTDSAGNRITVTANADGTFTFTMPARGVTVEASFTLDIADPDETGVSGWLETGEHMAYMVGDDRGDFRPDANITRAEVVQMFYRLLRDQDVPVAGTFSDVEEDAWYARAVNVLASLGMVNGVGGSQFAPERAITRAEFAAIAARFAHAHNIGITFTDVPESHWAYDEICTAASYGWVNGVGGGRFAPDRLITRGEAAAMVNRMLGRLADKAAIDAGQGRSFPDVTDAHWAWYEIGEATTGHDYTMGTDMETWTVR